MKGVKENERDSFKVLGTNYIHVSEDFLIDHSFGFYLLWVFLAILSIIVIKTSIRKTLFQLKVLNSLPFF